MCTSTTLAYGPCWVTSTTALSEVTLLRSLVSHISLAPINPLVSVELPWRGLLWMETCDVWLLLSWCGFKGCSMSTLYFHVLLSNIYCPFLHTGGFHFGHLEMILLWVFANTCEWTLFHFLKQLTISAVLG